MCTHVTNHFRGHIQRVDQAAAAAADSGSEISAEFKFVHPVFAECPLNLSKEKYILTSVERILSRFGVDKTISAEPALHVINSVACQQIAVSLLDTWTDPKRLSRTLRSLLFNEQTEAAGSDSDEVGSKSDKGTETVRHFDSTLDSSGSSHSALFILLGPFIISPNSSELIFVLMNNDPF